MIERGRTTWIALALLLGCVPPHPPSEHPILREWGLYVAHVEPHGCDGCEALARGDRIDRLDGQSIVTNLDALADRQPHVIEFWDASADARATTTITLKTVKEPPELADAPPIWSAFTRDLAATPSWARRRMFARVIPELLLIDERGEPLTGLDLYGRSHVVVLFDWAASSDRQNAALCMQVLQKAQADLLARGIEIVFAQIRHPVEHDVLPMSHADLQAFFANNQLTPAEGGPLPPPPLYRAPNKTDDHEPRGIEPIDIYEQLGEAPNILLIDERGIIRWHSAGSTPDPEGKITVDMVYTINRAVLFALEQL